MLPRPQRLRSERDIRGVLRSGRRFRGQHITIIIGHRTQSIPQAAFVISRAAAKRAIDRNRVRRRLREIYRQLPALPRPAVVIAGPSARAQDYNTLSNELTRLHSLARHAARHR